MSRHSNEVPFPQAALLGCAVVTGAGVVLNSAKVQAGETVELPVANGDAASASEEAPADAPTTARMPASMTNIALRFGERGDGGTGPTRSRPPVIDLANSRLTFKFIEPIRLDQHCSKIRCWHGVTSASWLPAALRRLCRLIVAPSLQEPPKGIPEAPFGVRVKVM